MITFQESAIIFAPIEKVFAYIADPNQIPKWRKDVPSVDGFSGSPSVGVTFNEQINFMGKKQLLMKIIEYSPNDRIVIQAQHGMSLLPTQSFSFINQGANTKINLTVSMKVHGMFRLLQPILAKQLKKIWQGYFRNLNENLKN